MASATSPDSAVPLENGAENGRSTEPARELEELIAHLDAYDAAARWQEAQSPNDAGESGVLDRLVDVVRWLAILIAVTVGGVVGFQLLHLREHHSAGRLRSSLRVRPRLPEVWSIEPANGQVLQRVRSFPRRGSLTASPKAPGVPCAALNGMTDMLAMPASKARGQNALTQVQPR